VDSSIIRRCWQWTDKVHFAILLIEETEAPAFVSEAHNRSFLARPTTVFQSALTRSAFCGEAPDRGKAAREQAALGFLILERPWGERTQWTTSAMRTAVARDAGVRADYVRGQVMQLYRVGQVAEMLDVHPNTVRKWVKAGILQPVKLPGSSYNRFTAQEIDRLRTRMGLRGDNSVRLYRVGQVASMFGVHPNTIRKWVRTDILRSVKLPGSEFNRFTRQELNRLRETMGLPLVQDQA